MSLQKSSFCILLTTFILLCLCSTISAQSKCRALVLQGGGDKGAYEAGVLYGLINNAKSPEDFQYDVITGVSVGSVNAMCFAMYEKGNETAAVQYLVDAWRGITKQQVYKNWPLGYIQGLFYEPSLYNNDPMQNFVRGKVNQAPNKRKISVTTTDINSGARLTKTEKDWGTDNQQAADFTLYSSSIPVLFKYRNYENYTLIDGGTAGEGLDVEDAVRRCREVVSEDADIVIDVIFANNISSTDVQAENYKSLQVLGRYANIMKYVFSTRALHYAESYYTDVDFRYVIEASQKLPNQEVPLDFDPKNIEFMIQLGISDAKTALAEGEGMGRKKIAKMPKSFIKGKKI